MSERNQAKLQLLNNAGLSSATVGVVVGDTTAFQVCKEFALNYGARVRIEIYLSAASASGTLTFEMWTGTIKNASDVRLYTHEKDKAISSPAAGIYLLTLNPEVAGDQGYLPTGAHGILKVKTDGTATATIYEIRVLEAQA